MSKLYDLKEGYYNFMGNIVHYNGGLKAKFVNKKGEIKARILEYTGKYLGKKLKE